MDTLVTSTAQAAAGGVPIDTVARQATPADQIRFEQSLNREPAHPVAGFPEVTGNVAPTGAAPVAGVPQESLGDAILRGIDSIKNQYDTRADRIAAELVEMNGNVSGVQDLMRIQFELTQLNMQQELTAKLADKTSQGVQTLFRNQG